MTDINTYLACGAFDAVHIGHRKVIDALVKKCAEDEVLSVVVLLVDKKEKAQQFVYSYDERKFALEKMGVDNVEFFDIDSTNDSVAAELVEKIFLEKYHATKLFTGDFDGDKIEKACVQAGIQIEKVAAETFRGEPVNTTMIARASKNNDFTLMQKLMGHKYFVIGEIVHGKGEGRKFGMPTANIAYEESKILPPHGVYATKCRVIGKQFMSCTNIGLRPSADNMQHITVETHILDFDRDIYGEQVVLEIMHYIRPVMKFSGGIAQVKKQVDKDILAVRQIKD